MSKTHPNRETPEQLESYRDAGPAADVYSAGATLYQFLADKPPFEIGPLCETFSKILNDPPEPLSTFRPDLPDGLVAQTCPTFLAPRAMGTYNVRCPKTIDGECPKFIDLAPGNCKLDFFQGY